MGVLSRTLMVRVDDHSWTRPVQEDGDAATGGGAGECPRLPADTGVLRSALSAGDGATGLYSDPAPSRAMRSHRSGPIRDACRSGASARSFGGAKPCPGSATLCSPISSNLAKWERPRSIAGLAVAGVVAKLTDMAQQLHIFVSARCDGSLRCFLAPSSSTADTLYFQSGWN